MLLKTVISDLLYNFKCPHSFFVFTFKLQQMEEAQLQQREANLTALAAIGPRRKRPLDQTGSQVGMGQC